MNNVRVIAANVFKEALRRKDIYVVAVLSLVIIGASAILNFWGARGLEKFLTDISLTVIFLFSTIIAVVVAARQIPSEMEARTLYPLLAKPVSRVEFIFGKFLGAYGIAVASMALFLAEFFLALVFMAHGSINLLFMQAMYAKCLELGIIVALTLLASTLMTHSAAVTVSLLFAFGWQWMSGSLTIAAEKAEGTSAIVFRTLYYIIPHIEFFNWKTLAVHKNDWPANPTWLILFLTLYAGVMIMAMLGCSWLRFRKQAL